VFGSEGNIYALSTDGTARQQLTRVASGAQARDPTWSPDGTRIAYAHTPALPAARGPGGLVPLPVTDIYAINADGSDAKVLVPHTAPGVGYETPAWAPDGKALYVTYTELLMESNVVKDQLIEIARVAVGGGTRQSLVPGAMFPALSADGRRLAFVLSHPDGQALALADADGKNIKVLVPAGRMDGLWAPRFAPDGQSIAFAAVAEMAPVPAPPRPSGQSDPPAPGGSGASSSPPPPAAPAQPRPSPVGRPAAADGSPPVGALRALAGELAARLALLEPFRPGVAQAHGLPMDVFVVDIDGSNLRRLTHLGEDNPAAVWSPDGRQLAIVAGGGIYRFNADGSDLTQIDQRGGHGTIDWRPRGG
jgi:Tol biopolymer transport system component